MPSRRHFVCLARARARVARSRVALLAPAALVLFAAACSDSGTSPLGTTDATPDASVSPSSLQIWWPTDNAHVTGVQPFKALLSGYNLNNYTMTWQLDPTHQNPMADNYTDAPHKEAAVDVTTWTWNGVGPYIVTFVAKDRKGRVLVQRDVPIYVDQPITPPPPPPPPAPSDSNPLAGVRFWVNPNSNAKQQADAWRSTRASDAAQLDKIASQPESEWFGDWNANIQSDVNSMATTITNAGAVPVFVAYNIPLRDCNSYSGGGATSASAYMTWIRNFANGIGSRRAVVILEPDALPQLSCLSAANQQTRIALIKDAIVVLKAMGGITVYVDAGNPAWIAAPDMANRLNQVNIAAADGFALNVSNFHTNADNLTYGTALTALIGNKHFVIDNSRNGLGSNGQWCNPDGRALGLGWTTSTGSALVDAFMWIKRPGESDGTCNGGPSAGAWWADYALGLASRASTPVYVASN
jgi:endoglucanase